jgi:hypothetical protein
LRLTMPSGQFGLSAMCFARARPRFCPSHVPEQR